MTKIRDCFVVVRDLETEQVFRYATERTGPNAFQLTKDGTLVTVVFNIQEVTPDEIDRQIRERVLAAYPTVKPVKKKKKSLKRRKTDKPVKPVFTGRKLEMPK